MLSSKSKRVGFRRVKLIQEPFTPEANRQEPGTSFHFEVNDVPMYMGGKIAVDISRHNFNIILCRFELGSCG